MDEIVDENLPFHALQEQRNVATNFRNLGIGIMGLHDMLIKLGFMYSSHGAKAIVTNLMEFIIKNAILSSSKLAKEKGTFPGYNEKIFDSEFFNSIEWTDDELKYIKTNGLRNSTLLSVAPAGLK